MKIKRRKYEYIDPEVQGALTRRLVSHWALFLIVACGLSMGLKWMLDPFAPLSDTLADVWYTHAPLLAVLFALAPVFIYDAVRLSNRFTGPVHRLRQATRQLAEGKTPDRVEFRDNDFWKELAVDFNRIAERLDDRQTDPTPSAQSV